MKQAFREAFPEGNITNRQLWFLVRFAKFARKRCVSNVAFNNAANEIFGDVASFREVTKTKKDGTKYPGLKITMKDESKQEPEQEEEDG